jgi:hypothetical protein
MFGLVKTGYARLGLDISGQARLDQFILGSAMLEHVRSCWVMFVSVRTG